jgi:hypothetical protein
MRSIAFAALGLGFVLMGAGLYALTLRKPKETPATPTKSQLREQSALSEENKKMRIGAGVIAAVGLIMFLLAVI